VVRPALAPAAGARMMPALRRVWFSARYSWRHRVPRIWADLGASWRERDPNGSDMQFALSDPRHPFNRPSPMVDLFYGDGAYDRMTREHRERYG
jgi:hypothetical protein